MNLQNKKALNVPKLRFPEFLNAGEWEEKQLVNLISLVTPPKKLLSKSYLAKGLYPIIDQSQNYICGWTNDPEAVIAKSLPLIIFGDHTCVLKFVMEPFVQGADGIKILKTNGLVEPHYLYQFLLFNPLVMESYKRHFSTLKEKIIAFPRKKTGEQQKIADCLTSLDKIIAKQSQKLNTLKAHKKGLMQNLFPANNKTTPKLRFSEFKGRWKNKKLGTEGRFLPSLTGKSGEDFGVGVSAYITYMNVFTNTFVDNKILGLVDIKDGEKQNAVIKGDVMFTVSSETRKDVGMSSVLLEELENCYLNSFCTLFRFFKKNALNSLFLGYCLRQQTVRKYFASHAQGIIRFNLSRDIFKNLPFLVPDTTEQQKIANCLTSLDDIITAQSQKIATLKAHKKGLIQQLFPIIDEVSK